MQFGDFQSLRDRLSQGEIIEEYLVVQILDSLIDVLRTESNIVTVRTPVVICGDIHGQYEDLMKLFQTALNDFRACPVRHLNWIFMGDYVDRGSFSLNTFLLLASHKLENPGGFFLLRGNHESRQISQTYGFYAEIVANYSHEGLWVKCMEVFDLLPIAALTDGRVLSLHGGLSPSLVLLPQLLSVERRKEIPDAGLLADLTWSDPERVFDPSGWRPSTRGAGWFFDHGPVEKFCRINGLRMITRSHQLAQTGFHWYYDRLLLNVWSAPNYGGAGNPATVLRLGFPGKEEFDLPVFRMETTRIPKDKIPFHANWYFA
jgi:diadenosine tetraphosphatase ApaH/serine/threonine PP2A family protein phosphatase